MPLPIATPAPPLPAPSPVVLPRPARCDSALPSEERYSVVQPKTPRDLVQAPPRSFPLPGSAPAAATGLNSPAVTFPPPSYHLLHCVVYTPRVDIPPSSYSCSEARQVAVLRPRGTKIRFLHTKKRPSLSLDIPKAWPSPPHSRCREAVGTAGGGFVRHSCTVLPSELCRSIYVCEKRKRVSLRCAGTFFVLRCFTKKLRCI
jgi:hypothetical protein